jgi:antitoxin (DNA-binding transcriptional repressor) of toxin-antitoxin stability system
MKKVGLRELKSRLSEYMRLVRAGEHLLVTDREDVIAELVPPMAATPREPAAALGELPRRGLLRPPTADGRASYQRIRQLAPTGTAQHLLNEERAGRRLR